MMWYLLIYGKSEYYAYAYLSDKTENIGYLELPAFQYINIGFSMRLPYVGYANIDNNK